MGGQPPKPPGQKENTSSSSLKLETQDVYFTCVEETMDGNIIAAKKKTLPYSDRIAKDDGFVFQWGLKSPFFYFKKCNLCELAKCYPCDFLTRVKGMGMGTGTKSNSSI